MRFETGLVVELGGPPAPAPATASRGVDGNRRHRGADRHRGDPVARAGVGRWRYSAYFAQGTGGVALNTSPYY